MCIRDRNTIRADNNKKLDEIRGTVEEKLQDTLQQRINDSFKTVSAQLEQVYKGLGEMQNLAADVGSLKQVLSGVKTLSLIHIYQLDGTEDTTEFSDDARADSMILVSMDIKDHVIRLVSIERGTGVPILLDGYEDQYDWITHTFRYGGPKLTMKTVEECYNIEVDHFVRVNFNSFVQIVNAVGGVDIDITEMEAKALNWEVPSNSMLIVNHVDPGLNHFDGYTALQYARLRKIDNDWKRVERQRTVIEAVLDQVKNASVMELDNLLNTVLPLIQTNFTKTEIAALLVQLPGFLG